MAGHALPICRPLDRRVTPIMFDLDDFKAINDHLGHDQGDRALTIFATCLLKTFRASDVVACLGGDEFCVLFTGNEEHQIGRVLERPRENLDARCADARVDFQLRFTADGTAFDPKRQASVEDLLRDADGRMYARKREKKTNSSRGRGVAWPFWILGVRIDEVL